jgi:hypothetical protein
MAKPKGAQKDGGRVKGTENKLTKSARELFVNILEGQVQNIENAFEDVLNGTDTTRPDPAKYLELYAKYAQYFIPKKIDLTTDGDKIEAPIIQILPPSE